MGTNNIKSNKKIQYRSQNGELIFGHFNCWKDERKIIALVKSPSFQIVEVHRTVIKALQYKNI